MGARYAATCKSCGTDFTVAEGGGFMFDLLHCETCGQASGISHADLGDIHFGYVKGLPGPYASVREDTDAQIKAGYQGAVLTREQYESAAEDTLDPCACGGRFRYRAPQRCPGCRSTSESWDRNPRPFMFAD